MKPITFKGYNAVYAKDQEQYQQLPAHRDADGVVTSCWELTWKERWSMLWNGRFFISMMTFRQQPQPIYPSIEFNPTKTEDK